MAQQDDVAELVQLTHQCGRAPEHGTVLADGSCQTETFHLAVIRPEWLAATQVRSTPLHVQVAALHLLDFPNACSGWL